MVNRSTIPHIENPKFKPSIPEYMVDKIENDETRFVIEQLSVIKQQNAWQALKVAEIYDYTRKINGKVIELEEFRQFILNEYISFFNGVGPDGVVNGLLNYFVSSGIK